MNDSAEELLRGDGITVEFSRGGIHKTAVRSASVVVHAGEAVGLIGESGSGKSTLGRALAGIQPMTRGSIEWLGREPQHQRWSGQVVRSDRSVTQMVFQDPYGSLDPHQRAVDCVAETLRVWRGLGRSEARAEAFAMLLNLGISDDQARRFPRQLSGGQRQRVSLARSLAPRPRVLIADEPTSAIDQSAQAGVLNLLTRLRKDLGLALLLISHDLRVIRGYTSRVYVMTKGEIVESGETASVFDNPQQPYTRELIAAIP